MAEPLLKQARPKKHRKQSTTPRVTPSILEEGLRLGTALKAVLPRDIREGGTEYFKRHGLEDGEVYTYSRYEIYKRGKEKYHLVYVINAGGRELKYSFHCSFFRIVG